MNKVIINQTLHGYDHGHSLLESSTTIKSDSKRNLMIMSDMSGSSMKFGFEEYVTGYPLKEMNMYALAKTWHAPEMQRPGCVWTHTLLIHFSDLIRLDNFFDLTRCFTRPNDNLNLLQYSKPIDLYLTDNHDGFSLYLNKNIAPDFIKELFFQLYSRNNSAILIQSENSLIFEKLILSIWIQQWPRLKRNFAFCTGAISPRSLDNRILDLQVIPLNNDRNLLENKKFIILNPFSISGIRNEKWVDVLYNDLPCIKSNLRTFFNVFGADVTEDKNAIVPLVELFDYFTNTKQSSISETIEMLHKHFPLAKDAITLKKNLLSNRNLNYKFELPNYDEESILFELATTDLHKSFDYDKLEFSGRFQILFRNNRKLVLDLLDKLISSNINPNGEFVIKAIAEAINENDLELLSTNYHKLLLIFISINPQFAYNKHLWEVGTSGQNEIFNILSRLNNIDWQTVIEILLDLNAKIDEEIILNKNIDLECIILNWINKGNSRISNKWLDFLRSRPIGIINWIESNSKFSCQFLKILPMIINPNSQHINNYNSQIWLKIISNSKFSLDYYDNIKFKAFILAVAFKRSDDTFLKLISFSFEDVYKAALKDQLDYNSWKILEVHTKPLSFWKEWDKCKKLRNALFEKFVEFKWPIDNLNKIFKDEYMLKEIHDYLND